MADVNEMSDAQLLDNYTSLTILDPVKYKRTRALLQLEILDRMKKDEGIKKTNTNCGTGSYNINEVIWRDRCRH